MTVRANTALPAPIIVTFGIAPKILATFNWGTQAISISRSLVRLLGSAPVTFCPLKAPIAEIWGKLRNFS